MRLTLFNMYLCQLFLRFRVKLGLDPDICFQSGFPATSVLSQICIQIWFGHSMYSLTMYALTMILSHQILT